ncbi:MAG: hypothetical protein ACKPKO_19695, partial [Candidatus Fonsibacter sp.]
KLHHAWRREGITSGTQTHMFRIHLDVHGTVVTSRLVVFDDMGLVRATHLAGGKGAQSTRLRNATVGKRTLPADPTTEAPMLGLLPGAPVSTSSGNVCTALGLIASNIFLQRAHRHLGRH